MNQFFMGKVRLLRNSIPATNMDPLYKLRESMRERDCSLIFKAVHPREVMKIISKLKIQNLQELMILTLQLSSW